MNIKKWLQEIQKQFKAQEDKIEEAILQSLITRSKHGYEILQAVQANVDGNFTAPQLYRYIRKLEAEKKIEVDFFGTRPGYRPKYRLTEIYHAEYMNKRAKDSLNKI